MAIQMNNSHREEATRITFNNLQIIGQIVQVEWEEEERNWVIGYRGEKSPNQPSRYEITVSRF
jgi:hypothetical protein